ncbi:MAG: helix-turn-helix domain-containing protein [Gammaproteobacteria bacterium]
MIKLQKFDNLTLLPMLGAHMPLILQTENLDELMEVQQGWDLDYRILDTGDFEFSLYSEGIDGFQIDLEIWSRSIEVCGTSPDDSFSFVMPAYEDTSFLSRGKLVDARGLAIYEPGSDLHAVIGEARALLAVSIDKNLICDHAGGALGERLTGINANHLVLPEPVEMPRMLRANLIGAALSGAISRETSSTWIRDEIMLGIATILLDGGVNRTSPGKEARYRIARLAQDIMLRDLGDPPTLLMVCEELEVSERTLFYAFTDIFGTTPKAFLRIQRLQACRKLIGLDNPNDNITGIMTRFGFYDAGHFAKDYRNVYGELPSDTLRSSRQK